MSSSVIASRLAPAIAVVAVASAVLLLPGRYHLLPPWCGFALLALLLVPMLLRCVLPASAAIARIERTTTIIGTILLAMLVAATLAVLIGGIISRTRQLDALTLLASSTALWMMNVVAFGLLYWTLDNGGPDARAGRRPGYPDFLFAQATAGDAVPPNWLPEFVDYLFVSFTTQTAFSPTDTIPLNARGKYLMMLQSLISLVTLVVVASRAIGILQ